MSRSLPLVPPARLGFLLTERRSERRLTLADLAAQANRLHVELDRSDLWAAENGMLTLDDTRIATILALYRLPRAGSLGRKAQLLVDQHEAAMWSGRYPAAHQQRASRSVVLRRYLSLIQLLRDEPASSAFTLRADDLDVLAATYDGTAEDVEAELRELMEVEPTARRLRRLERRVRVPAAGLLVGLSRLGALVIAPRNKTPAQPNAGLAPAGLAAA